MRSETTNKIGFILVKKFRTRLRSLFSIQVLLNCEQLRLTKFSNNKDKIFTSVFFSFNKNDCYLSKYYIKISHIIEMVEVQ